VSRAQTRLPSLLLVVTSLVALGGERRAVEDTAAVDEANGVEEAEEDTAALAEVDGGKHKQRRGGCPPSMARVGGSCIDRFEAPNLRGEKPLVMQSANEAQAWCAARRKRLCTEDEWIGACEGDEGRAYPYGAVHVDGRCNDDQPWRRVDEATLAKWPAPEAKAHARELDQALPSGAKRQCQTPGGVYDLTGNVEEWVVRTREHANAWPYVLIGCYWSGCYGGKKPTCHSTNNAHGPEFRFYETGFRCCSDAGTPK
jgi:formylglycine-generating enzyme required for sulfatase activity